jgi:hypothetical protein
MNAERTNAEDVVQDLRKWGRVLRENHRGFNPEWQAMFAAAGLIESLTAQLAEAQRRADAAVEDLTSLEKTGTYCRICKHYINGECHYPNGRCNWQWRGVGEGEKV